MIIANQLNIFLHKKQEYRMDAVQGDTGRGIRLKIWSADRLWVPGYGTSVQIRYRKPDGTGGLYDTLPAGGSAFSFEGDSLAIGLAPQVLSVAGEVELQVVLLQGGEELSTFTIMIDVQSDPSIGVIESADYISINGWIMDAVETQIRRAERDWIGLQDELVMPAFEMGTLVERDGSEAPSENHIRSEAVTHGGRRLYVSFPSGLVVQCIFYDRYGARLNYTRRFTEPFSIMSEGACVRFVVSHSDESPIADVQQTGSELVVCYPSEGHCGYLGNMVEMGRTSFSSCEGDGYYSFNDEDVAYTTDAPQTIRGGILEAQIHSNDKGMIRTIRTLDGEIWAQDGDRFVRIASKYGIPLRFNVYERSDGTFSAHISMDDIQDATEQSRTVICHWENYWLPLVMVENGIAYFSAVAAGRAVDVKFDGNIVETVVRELTVGELPSAEEVGF